MRRLAVLLAAAVLLGGAVAAAVLLTGDDPAPEEPAADAEIVHVELQQVADPTLFGTARFEELEGGRTRVSLEVVPPPVAEQAARISAGDCARPSEPVHELRPVTGSPDVGEPGRSTTDLEVPLDAVVGAGLAVEVDTPTPEDELALCAAIVRR